MSRTTENTAKAISGERDPQDHSKWVRHRRRPEHLPCPRCDSTNTKFCYYNNYNFSQPATSASPAAATGPTAAPSATSPSAAVAARTPNAPAQRPPPLRRSSGLPPPPPHIGTWVLGAGWVGLGLGSGFEEMGFGLGRAVWPISSVGDGGAVGAAGGANMIGSTWQLESGEGGFITGEDCFSLPDLAISTPGNGLK
ncbi:dof zinc finger protein DOF3.4-like [Camellia sinensis]|uniref:dof zinc finger protein DOF3.4-like n=1 Tax=Camellia sinensis TaxID=4442 RepID=UPI0010366F7B|nr:dof zinc finger protein DOF3.4-like [Camellia sinensis]